MDKKKKIKKRNRYVGKLPVNARITIDYTKKKPNVKFGYPRKDSAYQVIFSLPTLLPAMVLTIFLFAFFYSLAGETSPAIDYPEMDDCKTYSLHWKNKTKLVGITVECTVDGKVYTMKTELDRGRTFFFFKNPPQLIADRESFPIHDHAEIAKAIIQFLLVLTLFPFSIWLMYKFYTRTKIGQRIFPEIGKRISDSRYYAKFDKVPANKQIEIPLFKNIYLDYRATKEFSKNLLKMEIVEHPFTEIVRKGRKKKKITKTKKQVYLWKATFYFKEIPEEGFLELWWT